MIHSFALRAKPTQEKETEGQQIKGTTLTSTTQSFPLRVKPTPKGEERG
jgi:hypothetical protein